MTALAYWNLMASNGLARKACPAASDVGAERAVFGGWRAREKDAGDADLEGVV
jgi:hypothetical protein